MLIKHSALKGHLRQKTAPLYIIFGQDPYLSNDAASLIISAWKANKEEDIDKSVFDLNNANDWLTVEQEANSYSLFSKQTLLDLRLDKKTLDAPAKAFLNAYLANPNLDYLVILRAPNLPQKQLQAFLNHPALCVVQASPLNPQAMHQWITQELNERRMRFESSIPSLIQQYTEGNMLACAQLMDKLELVIDDNRQLTTATVQEQLINQCDFQLFELGEACIGNQPEKIIQLLRHAENTKAEPILVLWILTQEIRLLLQLSQLIAQGSGFNQAVNQLKIWPQRTRLYQQAVTKASQPLLLKLLSFCRRIDTGIKSNQAFPIWQSLEQTALSLCLAQEIGYFA